MSDVHYIYIGNQCNCEKETLELHLRAFLLSLYFKLKVILSIIFLHLSFNYFIIIFYSLANT